MTTPFRLRKVVKRYGQREVLSIDKLSVSEGRIYTILGPNGSGKSTLLRIMALLLKNDSGSLKVLGETVTWEKEQLLKLRRQITLVTQTAFMFQGSVMYNVAYGLKARHLPSREVKRRAQKALEMVGMAPWQNSDARTLSGGEKQKVALARALVLNPRILLLDEPTSNIDSASAAEIEKHIRLINREQGVTVVMVTHNLFQARRLADEILFLSEGRIVEAGSAKEMFENPRDARTAAFLRGDTVF